MKEETIQNARSTQSKDPTYHIIRIFHGAKNNRFVPETHVCPHYCTNPRLHKSKGLQKQFAAKWITWRQILTEFPCIMKKYYTII